jgi:succinyl-diaminopimelate desuccinylase
MLEVDRNLVTQKIDQKRDEIADLCARLVREPTPNPPGDTRGLVPMLVQYLRAYGLKPEVFSDRDEMPNVVTFLKGSGPGRHVTMNAHIDVFPVDPTEAWDFEPYAGVVRDGQVLGRGVADMKGGVAAQLAAITTIAELGIEFSGQVSLCLVSDEEMGARHGTAWLLDRYPEWRGDFCLSAEPTGPDLIWFGERGVNDWVVTARGRSGPGAAYGVGANAIERLAQAIPVLHRLEEVRGAFPEDLAAWRERAEAVLEKHIRPGASEVLDAVTLNIGLIEGGTNPAVSAVTAQMVVNFRVPLGISPIDLTARLRQLLDESGLSDIEVAFMHDERGISPATITDPASPFISTLAQVVEGTTGVPADLGMCGGATDMRFYRRYGVPAAMYGPRSYPVFAAAPNEFIYVRDLIHTAQVHAITALELLELPTTL